jgi:hypothetical protein
MIRTLCLIAAVVCFVLAAFGVHVDTVNLVWLGLAFWSASGIPFDSYTHR